MAKVPAIDDDGFKLFERFGGKEVDGADQSLTGERSTVMPFSSTWRPRVECQIIGIPRIIRLELWWTEFCIGTIIRSARESQKVSTCVDSSLTGL